MLLRICCNSSLGTCNDRRHERCLFVKQLHRIDASLFCEVTKMLCVHDFEAIWRDWRLPDWWKQPDCSHHVQVKSRGRTGESPSSWLKYVPWILNSEICFPFFLDSVLCDTLSQLKNHTTLLFTFLLSPSQSQLWTHILSLPSNRVFSSSALDVSSTCRRLYMDWSWTTRVYAWLGTSPLPLSALRMLMRPNQRRTRFVRLQIFSLHWCTCIDTLWFQ